MYDCYREVAVSCLIDLCMVLEGQEIPFPRCVVVLVALDSRTQALVIRSPKMGERGMTHIMSGPGQFE